MPSEPLDLVSVIIAVLAFVVSKDVAATVGPYGAIVVLACAGATLSLSGNEKKMTHGQSIVYVAIRILLAVSLTVSIAELMQHLASWMKPRYTLSPIAFAIGWIKDYDAIRAWFGSVIDRFTSRKIDSGQ